jgi:protein SCO1/2
LAVAAICLGGSCRSSVRTYGAEGVVVSVAGDRRSAVIRHGDIEGLMPAMTMLLAVKDPGLLKGISANDTVRFRLSVTSRESWISGIAKTGHSAAEPEAAAFKSLAEFSLTDQEGRTVRPQDLAGKALAVTFIYTRCPLPDYCPRFTGNFAKLQKHLAPRFGARFQLVSVSLDPAYDTPQVLKRYGLKHGSDFRIWTYLTGGEDEIRALARQYGVEFWRDKDLVNHSAACAVIAPGGKLYKLYRGNTWTSDEVEADLSALLSEGSP